MTNYSIYGVRYAVNGPVGARVREEYLRFEIDRCYAVGVTHEHRLVAAAQRLELAWLEAFVQLLQPSR